MTDNRIEKIRAEVERLKEIAEYNISHSKMDRDAWMHQASVCTNLLSFIDSMQEEPISVWHDASEKPNIKEKGGIFVITSLNGEYIGSRYYNHNDVTITFGNYDKWAYLNDLVNLSNVQRTGKNWKEEPVSEDFEKEVEKMWAQETKCRDTDYTIAELTKQDYEDCAHHFANWQKEQFEKNRLKHCNSITNEQAELEQGFIDQHLDKYNRMPTFLDAIEYGMKLKEQQMDECLKDMSNEIDLIGD